MCIRDRGGETFEDVSQFTYFGSKITNNGRNGRDIINRINQAEIVFNEKLRILTTNSISLKTRKRFLMSFIWSIVMYGCEL